MIETRNFRILRNMVLTVLSLWVAVPLYVVVSTSLKPLKDVSGLFQWIPREITASPYLDIWTTVPLAKYFQNSLIITICATACSVTVAVLAAYAIARLQFKGKRAFSLTVLSTQMFPGILFLLPLYLIFTQIRNMTGIAAAGVLPWTHHHLYDVHVAVRNLDAERLLRFHPEGAGRGVDDRRHRPDGRPLPGHPAGCQAGHHCGGGVLLHLSLGRGAVRLRPDQRGHQDPFPGAKAYASESDVFWNQLMAASVVVSLPVLIGFILVQKHLVAGLSAGAVK